MRRLLVPLLFVLVGYKMAGLLGVTLGLVMGLLLDPEAESKLTSYTWIRRLRRTQLSKIDRVFFHSTFSMFAKLAKADGRVSESEVRAIDQIMVEVFALDRKGRQIAIDYFQQAKDSDLDFQFYAREFRSLYNESPAVLRTMLEALFIIAVSDGELDKSEERLLVSASDIFGFNEKTYFRIARKFLSSQAYSTTESKNDLFQFYKVLNTKPDDSFEIIKKQYRKLVQEYHPDKQVAKGLPKGFSKFKEQKFLEIQEAFERIKQDRGEN